MSILDIGHTTTQAHITAMQELINAQEEVLKEQRTIICVLQALLDNRSAKDCVQPKEGINYRSEHTVAWTPELRGLK